MKNLRKKIHDLLSEYRLESFFENNTSSTNQVYIVGGWLRDIILGRTSNDLDLITYNAESLSKKLRNEIKGTLITLDENYQIYRVIPQNKNIYFDIAEIRGTLENDLKKRDFTINALAYQLNHDKKLIDITGGLKHIREKIIYPCSERALEADPLRIFRVYRFAALLDFSIPTTLLQQIQREKNKLKDIAGERIQYELALFLSSPFVLSHIQSFVKSQILPEILDKKNNEIEINGLEKLYSHFQKLSNSKNFLSPLDTPVELDDNIYKNHFLFLRFVTLLQAYPPAIRKKIIQRLRLSRYLSQHLKKIFFLSEKYGKKTPNKEEFLSDIYDYGHTTYIALFYIYLEKNNIESMDLLKTFHQEKELLYSSPLINGEDIKKLNIPPGPIYQKIIKEIEIKKMKKEIKSRDEALQYLNHFFK